jgi:hypothetical protein
MASTLNVTCRGVGFDQSRLCAHPTGVAAGVLKATRRRCEPGVIHPRVKAAHADVCAPVVGLHVICPLPASVHAKTGGHGVCWAGMVLLEA